MAWSPNVRITAVVANRAAALLLALACACGGGGAEGAGGTPSAAASPRLSAQTFAQLPRLTIEVKSDKARQELVPLDVTPDGHVVTAIRDSRSTVSADERIAALVLLNPVTGSRQQIHGELPRGVSPTFADSSEELISWEQSSGQLGGSDWEIWVFERKSGKSQRVAQHGAPGTSGGFVMPRVHGAEVCWGAVVHTSTHSDTLDAYCARGPDFKPRLVASNSTDPTYKGSVLYVRRGRPDGHASLVALGKSVPNQTDVGAKDATAFAVSATRILWVERQTGEVVVKQLDGSKTHMFGGGRTYAQFPAAGDAFLSWAEADSSFLLLDSSAVPIKLGSRQYANQVFAGGAYLLWAENAEPRDTTAEGKLVFRLVKIPTATTS